MKQIIYFGLTFILLANNSCKSTMHCSKLETSTVADMPILDTITKKMSKQTSESSMDGSQMTYASFPGGEKAMSDYIYSNLRYPRADSLMGKQGTVWVQFVVKTTGELSDFKIFRSLTLDCDAEALRVVKSMPKWIPVTNAKEVPIDMKYTLGVHFKLPEQK